MCVYVRLMSVCVLCTNAFAALVLVDWSVQVSVVVSVTVEAVSALYKRNSSQL